MNNSTLYTRLGDRGQTRIGEGLSRRVPKTSGLLEVLGTADELNGHIGHILSALPKSEEELRKQLDLLQRQLLLLKEDLTASGGSGRLTKADVEAMEKLIDGYKPCASFKDPGQLPGSTPVSAELDIARSVARRLERAFAKTGTVSAVLSAYLNRLSDSLYAMARYMDFRESIRERLLRQMPAEDVLYTTASVSLKLAKRLLERMEEEAAAEGLSLIFAVCDAAGHPVAVHVMDGALIVSYDVAVNKAFTSVAMKMKTKELSSLCAPGGSLYGLQNTNGGRIVIVGGGVMLRDTDGRIVGGLGVSGSTAETDTRMADLGERIFDGLLRKPS